jgi:hypothetical protein
LAVVLATSTVLVSCGGKKEASENASADASPTEVKQDETPVQDASPNTSPNAETSKEEVKKDEKKDEKKK